MRKLALVIFLLLICNPPVQAQAPYHQGKTVTIVVGTIAGDLYDLYARAIALVMGQTYSGKSQHHCSKHARRGATDRSQLLRSS